MSSNKAAKSGSTKPGAEVVKQEDVTIAVLIADSFSTRFAPVTESKPKVRHVQVCKQSDTKSCNFCLAGTSSISQQTYD